MNRYFIVCVLVLSHFLILKPGWGIATVNEFCDALESEHHRVQMIQDIALGISHTVNQNIASGIYASREYNKGQDFSSRFSSCLFDALRADAKVNALNYTLYQAMLPVINRNPLKQSTVEDLKTASSQEMRSHYITMALHGKKIDFESAFDDGSLRSIADRATNNDAEWLSTYYKTQLLCMEIFQQAPMYVHELQKYYLGVFWIFRHAATRELIDVLCAISMKAHQDSSLIRKMVPVKNRADRLYDLLRQKKLDQLPAQDSAEMSVMWQGGHIDLLRRSLCMELDTIRK